MALPDAWLENSAPGRAPRWSIVSGRTFQRRFQIQAGDPLAAVDLTGCSVSAEIVDRHGNSLVSMEAEIVAPATGGWLKVRLSPEATEALCLPGDSPPSANRAVIGRADIVVTDSNGDRVSVIMADVELIRGEAA